MSTRWTQAEYEAYERSQGRTPQPLLAQRPPFNQPMPKADIKPPRTTPKGPGFYMEPTFEGEKPSSQIERIFVQLWVRLGGPELEREVQLVPERRYRCDFVHELSKTILELQGFKDHTSAKGFHRDNLKHWELAKLGYRIITWDRKLINEENVRELIRLISK